MARCEKKLEQLMNNNQISNYHDICGDNETSFLFPLILNRLGYLLDSEDMKDFSKSEIKKRRVFNAIVKKIGPLFLMSKQIFEDRAELMGLEKGSMGSPKFPDDKPVIYVANHSFHDDILGTVLAAKRHAYVMFASLPQFYNTIDGPLLYGNGVVLVNRKIKENKSASLGKAKAVLENGCDLIVYPEGVWNKSPNQLCLPLWSGIYRLSMPWGTSPPECSGITSARTAFT